MEKSGLKTIIAFEGDQIVESVGSSEGKIQFLQNHDIYVKFKNEYTRFYTSGVFQICGGPPIIILPWFLKNPTIERDFENVEVLDFFDSLREIKYFLSSMSSLNSSGLNGSLREVLCHSFLKRILDSLSFLMQKNYFNDATDNIYYIKGKWNIGEDLKKTQKPTKFNCTFSDLGTQIIETEFAKSVLGLLAKILKAKRNQMLIEDMSKLLRDVNVPIMTRRLLEEFRGKLERASRGREWLEYVDFVDEFIFGNESKSPEAGISYRFKLDHFFEEVVSMALVRTSGSVTQQVREDILGGSRWISSDGATFDLTDEKKATINRSIPDIIFSYEKYLSVIECKYKPLRAGFLAGEDDKFLKKISREDRNQILSFVLSIKPNFEIRNKEIVFNVVYPSYHVEDVDFSVLEFPFATLSLNAGIKKVCQKRNVQGTEYRGALKVNFVAINIKTFLKSLKDSNALSFSRKLLNAVTKQEVLEEQVNNPATNYQRQFRRKLAMSSILIDKLHDDPNFGRVKHAKILYLTDARLGLGLEDKYYRAAAGPVNIKSLKDEQFGIEPIAKKNSLFESVQAQGIEKRKVRYIPQRNLKDFINKTSDEFEEFSDEIDRIINFFRPLTWEQSEIVCTLFACWNDLILSRGKIDISDNDIFDEFLNNWHKNKERFNEKKDVLKTWLDRMKANNIVPQGMGVETIKLGA